MLKRNRLAGWRSEETLLLVLAAWANPGGIHPLTSHFQTCLLMGPTKHRKELQGTFIPRTK